MSQGPTNSRDVITPTQVRDVVNDEAALRHLLEGMDAIETGNPQLDFILESIRQVVAEAHAAAESAE